ncbi:aldo/keto reductase [Microbacterium rhizomatis]|uniref:Aldo/keto reductase n=1 Tax=Microbacterium rhizomatis TaxID=1631477 RepID=A0A5J5J1Z6_9MICO|nr:aldo/keto reductase [Microbacterium rhizomatis]KAA9107709.1 aldo/keto reductase [Microbacterium rhizomatis]
MSSTPRKDGYRTLGRSGAVVFEQALGTMTFGAEADETTSHAIIDAYVAAGGNFIDTADVYSSGTSEQIIGRWIAAHPTDAAQMVIATKGRFPMGAGPNDLGTSRRHLRVALDDSLRRLGVEHIDLYQMHAWDAITPLDETLRFLDDAITQGKIGYYGFSNFTGWQLTKAVALAAQHRWSAPVTLQPQYSLLVRGIEHEIVPAALDAHVGLLPWSPLGGGWLSGKYRRDVPPTGSTRLGENPERGMEAWKQRNTSDRTWQIIDEVTRVADAHGVSASQVALAWLSAQPGVTSVILGARSVQQLRDNMGAVDLDLDPAELEALTVVSAPPADDYPYGAPGVAQRHRNIHGGR